VTVGLATAAAAVAVGTGVVGTGVSTAAVGAIGEVVGTAVGTCVGTIRVAVGSASDEHAVIVNAVIAMKPVTNNNRSLGWSDVRIMGSLSIIEGPVSTYERGYSVDW